MNVCVKAPGRERAVRVMIWSLGSCHFGLSHLVSSEKHLSGSLTMTLNLGVCTKRSAVSSSDIRRPAPVGPVPLSAGKRVLSSDVCVRLSVPVG